MAATPKPVRKQIKQMAKKSHQFESTGIKSLKKIGHPNPGTAKPKKTREKEIKGRIKAVEKDLKSRKK